MLGRTLFLQWHKMNLIFPMESAIHKRPKIILNKIIGYAGIYQGKWLEMNPLQCACWFGHFDANALYVFFSWVSSLKNPVKKLQLTEGLVCTLTNALCTCERSVKVWSLQAYNRTSPKKHLKVWICSSCIRAFNPNIVELHLLDNHISECNTPYVPWYNKHWEHQKIKWLGDLRQRARHNWRYKW